MSANDLQIKAWIVNSSNLKLSYNTFFELLFDFQTEDHISVAISQRNSI